MLKEKIGQMLMIGFKGTELKPEDAIVKAILGQQIGGVILFDYDYPTKTYDHNIKNPTQLKHLTQQLQHYAKQAAAAHTNVSLTPLLIGIDYEGGKVERLKETYGFPKTLGAAEIARLPIAKAREHTQQMALTLQTAGININFAPVLDVNVNPENPVIGQLGRSFSSNADKVIKYAALFSESYREHGIICAYKHFPGHGSSSDDTHAGFVDVTSSWQECELNPYKALLPQSGDAMVMTAHVVHNGLDNKGYPASLSYAMTQELLREKLHFNGVVVTDDMQMKAITDNYSLAEAVRLAINAGADILIFGNQLVTTPQDPQHLIDMIYADVRTGKIAPRRIDEAYQRIIALKAKLCHRLEKASTKMS